MRTDKQTATHRLKIIQGQINKILEMVESNRYCIDIMTQSLAVQKSLASLNRQLLANHLKTCVVDHIKSGQEEKAVSELMHLYHLEDKNLALR